MPHITQETYMPPIKAECLDWSMKPAGTPLTPKLCRQLGYFGHAKAHHRSPCGSVTRIKMTNVGCTGRERCIRDCTHSIVTSYYSTTYRAGVTFTECSDKVELRGGTKNNTMYSGNVWATNINGSFGPVCDDYWDLKDAGVVCRQLGYFGQVEFRKNSPFGSVPVTFAMDDVACSGDESCLADCSHDTAFNCGGGEGAGVICYV